MAEQRFAGSDPAGDADAIGNATPTADPAGSGSLTTDAATQAWLTGIAEGTADMCTHDHYVYFDPVQGVWVHEDDGATCDEVLP